MNVQLLAIIGALALLTRFGHTLHIMGAVRARSVAAVAARSLIGTASLVLLIFLVGYATAQARVDPEVAAVDWMVVYFTTPGAFLAIVTAALLPASMIGGATAERARVLGSLLLVVFLTLAVLPSLAWAGGKIAGPINGGAPGLLWPLIVSHLVAATAGLSLAWTIGPRTGKYNRDGSANFIPAHSLPTMITGDLLLLIGLPMMASAATFGAETGGRVVNALLGASAATVLASCASALRGRRFDVMQPWFAAIAGSVCGSISAPAAPLVAIAMGAVVGFLLPIVCVKTDLRLRIDEASGLALPHLLGAVGGAIGAVLGIQGDPDPSSRPVWVDVLLMLAAVVAVVFGSLLATALPALVLHRLGWLRVGPEVENEGLDLGQHDINAYPDFQQTLIKSYHLRQ